MDKHIEISTFSYKDQDFDILIHKNKLSYVFEVKGERYGNAVEIKGRGRKDNVNASIALILNLIDTYDAVQAPK